MSHPTDAVQIADRTVHDLIVELLGRRGVTDVTVGSESTLTGDLQLESLEIAEISVALEEALGTDPFTEGLVPATVGELIGFYRT